MATCHIIVAVILARNIDNFDQQAAAGWAAVAMIWLFVIHFGYCESLPAKHCGMKEMEQVAGPIPVSGYTKSCGVQHSAVLEYQFFHNMMICKQYGEEAARDIAHNNAVLAEECGFTCFDNSDKF